MARKRFVKLCMEAGYDRNSAGRLAEITRGKGYPYPVGYIAALNMALKHRRNHPEWIITAFRVENDKSLHITAYLADEN